MSQDHPKDLLLEVSSSFSSFIYLFVCLFVYFYHVAATTIWPSTQALPSPLLSRYHLSSAFKQ